VNRLDIIGLGGAPTTREFSMEAIRRGYYSPFESNTGLVPRWNVHRVTPEGAPYNSEVLPLCAYPIKWNARRVPTGKVPYKPKLLLCCAYPMEGNTIGFLQSNSV